MSHAAQSQIRVLLGQVLLHLKAENFTAAEGLLAEALAFDEAHCDTLHLFGQMRRVQRRFSDAEDFYRRALLVEPGRPELHHHLGQLLVAAGRLEEACLSFQEAVRLRPNFADAHLDLGRIFSQQEKFTEAETACRQALRLQPNLLAAKQALSAVLIQTKRAKEAEQVLRGALGQIRPGSPALPALEQNLAIAISGQGRHAEALTLFAKAQAAAPALPQADYNRANTLQELGRLDEAEAAYRRAVAHDPLDFKAHLSLAQLLYRLGRNDFLSSYDEAMKSCPDNVILPLEKGRLFHMAERFEEAREEYSRALTLAPDHAAASNGLASALAYLGRYSEAVPLFEHLAACRPDDVQIRCNFADCLLRMADWERAGAEAEGAVARDPYNQLAWALKGIALRGLGDQSEHDLNDYERLVDVVMLEPPAGFSTMEDFNSALEAQLITLHRDVREHINQTSRLGTKTLGTLFGAGHDLVERLRERIDEAVGAYIARMAKDPMHPLFSRVRNGFAYWGSWSTRLGDCGYHVNHVHPRGWISSAYYVAVPEVVEDDTAKQGWLKFGEPPFETAWPDAVRRAVKPVPGQLVLFPSYMWHGTNPFHSAQIRTTIAFDAVPK